LGQLQTYHVNMANMLVIVVAVLVVAWGYNLWFVPKAVIGQVVGGRGRG
jgi:hypothetical protein